MKLPEFWVGLKETEGELTRNDGQDRGVQSYRHLYVAAVLRDLCGGVGPS